MLFSILLSATSYTLGVSAAGSCLVGGSCFPSLATLASFNSTLGGKLYSQRPIGASCYPSDPLYNAAACANATSSYGDADWRSSSSSSYEQLEWEICGVDDTCLLPAPSNLSAECGQGNVPSYAVHATNVSDVQNYVKFATAHNLPIVIKNTGHDYSGRSSGKGTFALWTRNLQGISRNSAFVPKGCCTAPVDSISAEAGANWGQAYDFASSHGLLVVGGHCPTVGTTGGWIQGGGHSILTPTYGLGIDNLLQADIVTADGQLQTISECSNPDLFWAVRGGGAGSYGVLTSVTYKAHPDVPMHAIFIATNATTSTAAGTDAVVEAFTKISPQLGQLGIGGYLEVFSNFISYSGVLPGGNMSTLQNALLPVTTTLPADAVTFTTFPNFLPFQTYISTGTFASLVGANIAEASRLIPRHYMQNNATALVQAVRLGQNISSGDGAPFAQINMITPPASFNLGKTSVTPAFYQSAWHVTYAGIWASGTPKAGQQAIIQSLHNAAQVLRNFAPDGGAYSNECDIFEPNHEQSFWGSNAARLKTIKKTVDPGSVFQVWQGIGWDSTNPKYTCYGTLNPGLQVN